MVDQDKLATLNADIQKKGHVDREHLLEFLRLIPTNDGAQVAHEVRAWLQSLHDDPKYDKVVFPIGDIDAVLNDLTSYGRLHPNTILELRNGSSRELTA